MSIAAASMTGDVCYFSPRALVEAYHSIRVPLTNGGMATVSVRKYIIVDGKTKLSGGRGTRTSDGGAGKEKFDQARKSASALGVSNMEVLAFFDGKATPGEIARVLVAAQTLGLAGSTQADLQDYCDKQAGVDCSGFVTSFFNMPLTTRMNTPAGSFRSGDKSMSISVTKRKSIDEFQALDVIVWLGEGHIAIIDSIDDVRIEEGKRVRRAIVSESTISAMGPICSVDSEGPQTSQYVFRADPKAEATVGMRQQSLVGADASYVRPTLSARTQPAGTSLIATEKWTMERPAYKGGKLVSQGLNSTSIGVRAVSA
ncbi:MAG: hypothetical protein JO055_01745 [Alphaproteobacteria bacterium]|nr:hypothetical protein [Alphaproteobacteria bacterium]